jgi:hypothetical protein
VLLDSHVCVGIVAGHLLAAIAPQAFHSVPKRFLSVHLENMLLQSLEVVEVRSAVLPLALV